MQIDTTTYNKAKAFPRGHGYSFRGTSPSSIVLHTTNNPRRNTSFESEADFLYKAPNVSAHFLIGKDARIVQFLEPRAWQAWHAGGQQSDGTWTALPAFANPRSIGIEIHYSLGDLPYPVAQEDAITELVRSLMERFTIPPSLIDTHRAIALPAGRKIDPSGWSDRGFYIWRAGLVTIPYRALHTQAVFEAPRPDGAIALRGAAEIAKGSTVIINEIKAGWAHLANGIGFVPVGVLERIP